MSGKTWHKLTPMAQGIWDQLDDESKALILGWSPESKRLDTFSRIKPGRKGSSRGANKINLHDISAHDLLANYHQYQAHQTDEDEGVVLHDEDVAGTTDEAPNPLLAFLMSRGLLAFLMSRGDSTSPGDLRNILSSTSNHAVNSKSPQQHQAKFANITYDVGKHRTTHRGALIDRGATVASLAMMHKSLQKLTGLSMSRASVTTKSRISRLSLLVSGGLTTWTSNCHIPPICPRGEWKIYPLQYPT